MCPGLPGDQRYKVYDIMACRALVGTIHLMDDASGPLAQRLELPTHNRLVLGSNPRGPILLWCGSNRLLPGWICGTNCGQVGRGATD